MSEDELINDIKELLYNPDFDYITLKDEEGFTSWHNVFEGLLDLYNNQKQLLVELQAINEYHRKTNGELMELIVNYKSTDYIHKDKIKAKIKSLEEKNHVVISNEYNKIEVMNEFKNEGAVDVLKELLEEE